MKLTVLSFENAAGNHWFDNNPNEYGITYDESHLIREYFQNYSGEKQHIFINALYKKFSGFFEGEPREWIFFPEKISKEIPLY